MVPSRLGARALVKLTSVYFPTGNVNLVSQTLEYLDADVPIISNYPTQYNKVRQLLSHNTLYRVLSTPEHAVGPTKSSYMNRDVPALSPPKKHRNHTILGR